MIVKILLSACFLIVPLVFFTDNTTNPFFVQNCLLYSLVALIFATWSVRFLKTKQIAFTRTFFDLAFFMYVLASIVGWFSSFSSASQVLHQTLFFNFLNYGTLLVVIAIGAYIISKNIISSGKIEGKGLYILLFLVWGGLWYFFPFLKTHISSDSVFLGVFDWYACALWILGIVLACFLLRPLSQENVLILMFSSIFLASVYGVLQSLGMEFLWPFEINQFATKAFSTFGNPNFLASVVVMLLPSLLLYYMQVNQKKEVVIYGILVFGYLIYLVFSGARSCWIGVIIALLMMWGFGNLRRLILTRKLRLFLLVVIIGLIGWGTSYNKESRGALTPIVKRSEELTQITPNKLTLNIKKEQIFQSLHQRLFMWNVAKEIFLARPVLGSGLGNFQMAFIENQPKILLKYPELRNLRTITPSPHNELLFQLSQGGIVGVGLFIFMFMVLFLEVHDFVEKKEETDKKVLLQTIFCGILGMLVDNMLNISLHAVVPAFIFWWLVGAEVSGVGKEEHSTVFSANPVSKTVALCIICLSLLVIAWQGLWFISENYSFKGTKYLAKNMEEAAKVDLGNALSLYPANTEAGFRLGTLLLKEKDYDKSLPILEKTIAASSYYEEVLLVAAIASMGEEDIQKSMHYLIAHLKLNPYDLTGYKLLFKIAYENMVYIDEEIMQMLERCLKLFPDETMLWKILGEIYSKQNLLLQAKDAYLRGLQIDALDGELLTKAKKLLKSDDNLQQREIVENAIALQNFQKKIQKFNKMSPIYQQKLRANLEKYIGEHPKDSNAKILLAKVLSLSNNDIKAKEILERILEEDSSNLWANLAISSLLYKAENTKQAKYFLNNALFYYPDNEIAKSRLELLAQKE